MKTSRSIVWVLLLGLVLVLGSCANILQLFGAADPTLTISADTAALVVGGTAAETSVTITVTALDKSGKADTYTAVSNHATIASVTKTTASFTITAVAVGTAEITVTSAGGVTKTVTVTVTAPAATTTLATPAAFTKTAMTADGGTFTWTAVTNASDYWLYHSTSNSISSAVGTNFTGTSGTMTGLSASTAYYFWLTADATGYLESDPTAAIGPYTTLSGVAVTPLATPGTFAYVAASVTDSTADFSWNAVTNATGYYVYYGTANDSAAATSWDGPFTGTTGTVTGLAPSTQYYFFVTAYDSTAAHSESAKSASTVTATTVASQYTITTAVNWSGAKHLTQNLYIDQGGSVTIAAGTVVTLDPGVYIYVNYTTTDNTDYLTGGKLIVNGTSGSKVTFKTSVPPTTSYTEGWYGLYVYAGGSAVIANAIIRDAGNYCAIENSGALNIQDSTISLNWDGGINVSNSHAATLVQNNVIENNFLYNFGSEWELDIGGNAFVTYAGNTGSDLVAFTKP